MCFSLFRFRLRPHEFELPLHKTWEFLERWHAIKIKQGHFDDVVVCVTSIIVQHVRYLDAVVVEFEMLDIRFELWTVPESQRRELAPE